MKKGVLTILVLGLVAMLLMVSSTGCERPAPEPPTPTAVRVLMSPQPSPSTLAKGPTTVSVLQTPGAGTPTVTIVWDMPTFTPTPQVLASRTPTSTSQPGVAPPTPTAVPAPGGTITHKVEWGDTLYALAARYGTTVSAIVAANNLPNPNFIRVGQTLIIPQGTQPTTPPGQPPQQVYIVQPGDTLFGIALRFNTSVAAIAQANGIVNPAFIRVGQRLTVPSGTAPAQGGRIYVVQPGDTLTAIAARFGTTVWAIAMANNLPNANFIRAGQTLIIPGQ